MTRPSDDDVASSVAVTNNRAQLRYEVRVGDELAGFTTYTLHDDQVSFNHAEVYPRWEGRGIGSALATAALDDVIANGKLITPLCPFIVDFVIRHPSYLSHVDEVHRARLEAEIATSPDEDA